jgi:ferritin heavy chain
MISIRAQSCRAARAPSSRRAGSAVRSAKEDTTAIVFRPFQEVKNELASVSSATQDISYARVGYAPECEAAVNEQINIEYTISYVYHALHAFFDRDNVGKLLPPVDRTVSTTSAPD